MRQKILRADGEVHIENALEDLRRIADVVTSANNDEETLAREAEDADVIIVSCFTKITAKVITSAKRLKGIVKYGVGVDNIDLEAATKRDILVVNCPEYHAETLADHAFALMLCLAKKLVPINRVMRGKAWLWPSPEYMGLDLFGKTLGIIGFGRIGRALARRALGFGMKMIASDPYVNEELVRDFGAELVNLEELISFSDFISILCPLTPETRGLIGEDEFKRMKETALIIDVSRGAIVEEVALITALRESWIAGAGFDVFSEEPLSPGHPLLTMNNVILTPHVGWYTKEAFERLERECVQRVVEILQGERPKNVVNVEVLERPGCKV